MRHWKMGSDFKRELFEFYRKSACSSGLICPDDALACPLCWRFTNYEDLSFEHIVPGAVGGRRIVLTCTKCNNLHGSLYDAHLASFQKTKDGFDGHGKIPAQLDVLGRQVAANVEWGNGFKNINIVGEASHPKEVQAIQEHARAGRIGELHLTLNLGYFKNRFQTGLLRCAYLALFKCFGYEYAASSIVQSLRLRICNMDLEQPRLGSMIGELRDGTINYDEPYFIVPGNVNGVQFFMVVVRLKTETVTHHFVFMPVPVERSNEFFDMMERCSNDNNKIRLTIPHDLVFT